MAPKRMYRIRGIRAMPTNQNGYTKKIRALSHKRKRKSHRVKGELDLIGAKIKKACLHLRTV